MKVIKGRSNAILTILASIILTFVMVAFIVVEIQQGKVISTLSESLDATREQVVDNGEKPVSPPAEEITGAAGVTVVGQTGARGQDGSDGRDGITPSVTDLLRIFGIYCGTSTCVGPAGADSIVPGPQGAAGLDSTVVGPAGADSVVPGPQGIPGNNGSNGIDGTNGTNGVDGSNGANATLPETFTTKRDLGNGSFETRQCSQEQPFVPEEPVYICTTSESPAN